MRIGSLFSGIGGLDLGLELALPGARTVWQVEQDPYARQVLAAHWPDADRRVTDVRHDRADQLTVWGESTHPDSLPVVDLICGGFPCQDISIAGTGRGLDGAKSGLWREFARLLRRIRPRYVVLENSEQIVHKGLGSVLGDLAALGYDAAWDRIGACDVGAPHRRWRWICVAWLADPDMRGRQGASGVRIAGGGGARTDAETRGERPQTNSPLPSPRAFALAHGLPGWMDGPPVVIGATGAQLGKRGKQALKCLGNAVVPAVAFQAGLMLQHFAPDLGTP